MSSVLHSGKCFPKMAWGDISLRTEGLCWDGKYYFPISEPLDERQVSFTARQRNPIKMLKLNNQGGFMQNEPDNIRIRPPLDAGSG